MTAAKRNPWSRVTASRYHYLSPGARAVADRVAASRRANRPYDESPSLATLSGRARNYAGRYKASRERVLEACRTMGVEVREIVTRHGCRVWLWRLAGEPWSRVVRVRRNGRGYGSLCRPDLATAEAANA